jgi:cytochrome oxidase Cu insertion factor (SCO1/SenC/PrrC family)
MTSNRSVLAIVLTAVFVAAAVATAGLFVTRGTAQRTVVGLPNLDPSPDATGLPTLFAAPTFTLVNEDNVQVSSDSLKGHPYVAAFIFTNCTSTCPMMSGKMSGLQAGIPQPEIKLVSFTVDPDRDTPDVLKKYAQRFKADESRWFFLTGAKPEMQNVESGFKVRLPRAEPTDNGGPEHSDRFILVDAKGIVRGIFDSKDDTSMGDLRRAAAKLAQLP